MSEQLLFDKLRYIDRLTKSGVAEDQARAHAEAMEEALRESVVTNASLDIRLAQLETKLTLRMGAVGVGVVTILAAIKFFG